MEEKKYPVIPPDAIVTVEMSGSFLKRLQFHLFYRLSKLSKIDADAVLKRIKENQEALTEEEDVIHMITSILVAGDQAAKAQNKNVYKTLEELKGAMEDPINES